MQTVVCMKWGDRYPADYVNRLWSMIKRNTARPTQLVCYTDDAQGIDPAVITAPIPDINVPERVAITGWRKIAIWRDDLEHLSGDVLFFDLDMIITGSIDAFFDFHPGEYCVIHNWTQPHEPIGNTSIFKMPVGKYPHIFERFHTDPEGVLAQYRIEQQYISGDIPHQVFWPAHFCVSFKHNLMPRWPLNFIQTPKLPPEVLSVAFTGKPDPDEAAVGEYPVRKAWKKLYKHVRPTPWIMEHWR
ncbi:MAG: hypothetical protein AAFO61_00925 [Pseudomonadota bacterium]